MSFSSDYGTIMVYDNFGEMRLATNTLPVRLKEGEKISYRSPMIVTSVDLVEEGGWGHIHRGKDDECNAVIKRTSPSGNNYCFEVTGTNLEIIKETIDAIYHKLGVKNLNWNDFVLRPEPCFSQLPKDLPNAWERSVFLFKCLKRLLIDYVLYNKN